MVKGKGKSKADVIKHSDLVENIKKIEAFLSKDAGKFRHFQEDNMYHTDVAHRGQPIHLVNGYRSSMLSVYVDRHNFEITIHTLPLRPGSSPSIVVESNKSMAIDTSFFFSLLREKQLEYEKLIHAAQQNQKK